MPAGSVSLSVTLFAVPVPVFVTMIVKAAVSPALIVEGESAANEDTANPGPAKSMRNTVFGSRAWWSGGWDVMVGRIREKQIGNENPA